MLYKLAHFFRDKLPFIWDLIDKLNAWLFVLHYGKQMKQISALLQKYSTDYTIVPMADVATDALVRFFAKQPEDAFKFFKPHGFDATSLKKLQNNKSFLAYIVKDKENIAGYCFLRSFFHGKGFRGRMVGIDYRGRGLGTFMNKLMNDVGFSLGLHIYETVSKDNVASYRSSLSASEVKVLEELPNNEVFLEILPNNSTKS